MSDDGLTAPSPIPAPRRLWSDAEWDRLRKGAGNAEWDGVLQGDLLVLSGGGGGAAVYAARFRRELAGWKIVAAEVETDPEVHLPDGAERESAKLQSVIEGLLR